MAKEKVSVRKIHLNMFYIHRGSGTPNKVRKNSEGVREIFFTNSDHVQNKNEENSDSKVRENATQEYNSHEPGYER